MSMETDLELRQRESPIAPDVPAQVLAMVAGRVKDDAIERVLLHALDVRAQVLRIRLISAPLDQLFRLDQFLRLGWLAGSSRRQR